MIWLALTAFWMFALFIALALCRAAGEADASLEAQRLRSSEATPKETHAVLPVRMR